MWPCLQKKAEEEAFEKELVAAEGNQAAQWKIVMQLLQPLKNIDKSQEGVRNFWKIYERAMTCFERWRWRRANVPGAVLQYAYFYSFTFGEWLNNHCPYCNRFPCEERLVINEFCQLLKMPYNIRCPVEKLDRDLYSNEQVVWGAIRGGREKILHGLLKYGVMFLQPLLIDEGNEWYHYQSAIQYLLYDRNDYKLYSLTEFWTNKGSDRLFLLWAKRRVFTVLRVILLLTFEMIMGEGRPPPNPRYSDVCTSRSARFRCLQYAFETIPEPIVTSRELRRIFLAACAQTYHQKADLCNQCFDEVIKLFEELYPEGAKPLEPRTLLHLSRCQVRENLRQAGVLPHGVDDLELPNNIRKYIVLEQ